MLPVMSSLPVPVYLCPSGLLVVSNGEVLMVPAGFEMVAANGIGGQG